MKLGSKFNDYFYLGIHIFGFQIWGGFFTSFGWLMIRDAQFRSVPEIIGFQILFSQFAATSDEDNAKVKSATLSPTNSKFSTSTPTIIKVDLS